MEQRISLRLTPTDNNWVMLQFYNLSQTGQTSTDPIWGIDLRREEVEVIADQLRQFLEQNQ